MDILEQYASIKRKIKALEDQAEELKAQVMDEIYAEGAGKALYTSFGTFTVGERKVYEYPEAILSAEKKLKDKKRAWESSEAAVLKTVSAFPIFRENE